MYKNLSKVKATKIFTFVKKTPFLISMRNQRQVDVQYTNRWFYRLFFVAQVLYRRITHEETIATRHDSYIKTKHPGINLQLIAKNILFMWLPLILQIGRANRKISNLLFCSFSISLLVLRRRRQRKWQFLFFSGYHCLFLGSSIWIFVDSYVTPKSKRGCAR